MSSSFALISEDELRAALALWTIKNSLLFKILLFPKLILNLSQMR